MKKQATTAPSLCLKQACALRTLRGPVAGGTVRTRASYEPGSLLADTDLTIAEVAAVVGFASQSHLASHLRRLLGVSPKAFRRSA